MSAIVTKRATASQLCFVHRWRRPSWSLSTCGDVVEAQRWPLGSLAVKASWKEPEAIKRTGRPRWVTAGLCRGPADV